jgi:hypothetical protein
MRPPSIPDAATHPIAKPEECTPHVLRHTFGKNLADAGLSPLFPCPPSPVGYSSDKAGYANLTIRRPATSAVDFIDHP